MDAIVLLIALVGGFLLLGFFVNRKLNEIADKQRPSDELMRVIEMLQAGSKEDRKTLLTSLQQNTQSINERLDNTANGIYFLEMSG